MMDEDPYYWMDLLDSDLEEELFPDRHGPVPEPQPDWPVGSDTDDEVVEDGSDGTDSDYYKY